MPSARADATAATWWSTGRLLLHPLAVGSIAVLALNDHVLKGLVPGLLTGKLSDVAGLVFFPLLLIEGFEFAVRITGRPTPRGHRAVVAGIALTAVGFVLAKGTEAGAVLFGWAWGTGQWLVSLGFIGGQPVQPVATVVDPTDLLALPALLGAWWIAGRQRQPRADGTLERRPVPTTSRSARPQRWLGALVAVAAAATSLATSEAPAWASTELQQAITLTDEQPAAARHLSWDVVNRDPTLSSVHLSVSVWTEGVEDGMVVLVEPAGVELSLIADEPAMTLIADDDFVAGRSLDLAEACRSKCHGGAFVVVRIAGQAPGSSLDLQLDAGLYAEGDYEHERLDADLALREDADRRFDGSPPTLVVRETRTLRVSSEKPVAGATAVLKVDPAVLRAPLAFPLVGRIVTSIETADASGHPNAHSSWITIGRHESVPVFGEELAVDRDWLSQCEPGRPCEVPIRLESAYDASLNSEDYAPSDPAALGFVDLRWSVEARLEAFDGRALPEGALVLSSP